jgi:hypothetical protein
MTLALCLMALLQASCETSGPKTEAPLVAPEPEIVTKTRIVDTGCDWNDPIFVSKSDVLSDATAKSILAHNRAGAAKCGWKPSTK